MRSAQSNKEPDRSRSTTRPNPNSSSSAEPRRRDRSGPRPNRQTRRRVQSARRFSRNRGTTDSLETTSIGKRQSRNGRVEQNARKSSTRNCLQQDDKPSRRQTQDRRHARTREARRRLHRNNVGAHHQLREQRHLFTSRPHATRRRLTDRHSAAQGQAKQQVSLQDYQQSVAATSRHLRGHHQRSGARQAPVSAEMAC